MVFDYNIYIYTIEVSTSIGTLQDQHLYSSLGHQLKQPSPKIRIQTSFSPPIPIMTDHSPKL